MKTSAHPLFHQQPSDDQPEQEVLRLTKPGHNFKMLSQRQV